MPEMITIQNLRAVIGDMQQRMLEHKITRESLRKEPDAYTKYLESALALTISALDSLLAIIDEEKTDKTGRN